MNKKQAKAEAINNTLTWGELSEIVTNGNKDGHSSVAQQVSKLDVEKIMREVIREQDWNAIPSGNWLNHKGKYSLSKNGMIIMNILREFG